MYNPFLSKKHCARFATRRAFQTGNVFHVIATNDERRPLTVVDDTTLFELADMVTIEDMMFTADPFAAGAA
jgi:hypothetical protein